MVSPTKYLKIQGRLGVPELSREYCSVWRWIPSGPNPNKGKRLARGAVNNSKKHTLRTGSTGGESRPRCRSEDGKL